MTERHSFIGIVEDEDEDDDDDNIYCPYCEEHFQKLVMLKTRQPAELEGLTEGELERLEVEAATWRQCSNCHSKWRKARTPHLDPEIDLPWETDVEIDNAGKHNATLYGRDQLRKTGRIARYREEARTTKLPKDKEVIAAIKKGLKVDNYVEYQVGE